MQRRQQVDYQYNSSIGKSHAAVSVVNALATGMGGAIGVAIGCEVAVKLEEKPDAYLNDNSLVVESKVEDHHGLLDACMKQVLGAMKRRRILRRKIVRLSVFSDIPPAVGLKSSSALSVAAVEALSKVFDGSGKLSTGDVLRKSCIASKKSGASLTGAYDDASACLLGGMVLTDNRKMKIVQRARPIPSLGRIALILVPLGKTKFTSSVNPRKVYSSGSLRAQSEKAFEFAKEGKVAEAIIMNSVVQCTALGYSFAPIEKAMKQGATASGISGKGPAIFALCTTNKVAGAVEKAWLEEEEEAQEPSRIISTRIVEPVRAKEKGI